MPPNHDRSVSQLIANPCRVTGVRISRTPIAQTLSSPANTPGLHVVPAMQVHSELGAGADHGLLQPAQVRRGIRRRAQVDDGIAHQLPRTVERERTARIDVVDFAP
jgi:hypothetical protein